MYEDSSCRYTCVPEEGIRSRYRWPSVWHNGSHLGLPDKHILIMIRISSCCCLGFDYDLFNFNLPDSLSALSFTGSSQGVAALFTELFVSRSASHFTWSGKYLWGSSLVPRLGRRRPEGSESVLCLATGGMTLPDSL